MNSTRRKFLHSGLSIAGMGAIGASTWLAGGVGELANANDLGDYKALVCVFLNGGNDGNNTLIPVDAAYGDYSRARGGLALSKDSLTALGGSSAGHQFAIHPGIAPLAKLYQNKTLAWIANMGTLVQPVTASSILAMKGVTPPFLFSHIDQTNIQQGWDGMSSNITGWAGRAIEALAPSLRHPLQLLSFNMNATLLRGMVTPVTSAPKQYANNFGPANLLKPTDTPLQALQSISQLTSANDWDNIRLNNLKQRLSDAQSIAYALANVPNPVGNFGTDDLSITLQQTVKLMLAGKNAGLKRQVFLVSWGSFDTHTGQLGTSQLNQDGQLATLGAGLDAFTQSIDGFGLTNNVITFSMSDFARTLQPVGGNGSDHAWGNHHFVMGGPVQGGSVLGTFPSLTLGGPDDMDIAKKGRWAPTTSTDQLGATLMTWMGLNATQLNKVFPNLKNFSTPLLNFL